MLGLRTSIPFLATAILLVAPAEATTSFYQGSSGETAFTTAIGGLTLLDPSLTFSGSDLGPGGLFNASGTGIDFLGFDNLNSPLDFTVNSGKLTGTPAEQATINFPATSIYAFGFHLTVASGFGSWCIELTQGTCDYVATNTSSSDAQFFGFVSPTPVSAPLYIRPLGGSGPTMVLNNFEAFTEASITSSVPEARTMLLVGLGLVILPLAHRRVRRRA
jgi:hypothetical protein